MTPLLIRGMHGLGDNIRQRAIVRQLMREHEVWLESSWVSIYHDLIAEGLKVIHKQTRLRTQAKNAVREQAMFSRSRPAVGTKVIAVNYPPAEVRRHGSVMAAMCAATGTDVAAADFRLPVPPAWRAKASAWLERWNPDRPFMLYRPLVDRPLDWGGCAARNPVHAAYAALFRLIRERFFVVSVADLVPGKEWIVGERIEADAECHAGELEFETLAALTSMSALVYCSPGFAGVLAQAVGTPVSMVFGGYERSQFFFDGAKDAPVLGIDPINPCECFSHHHACRKEIDIDAARERLAIFAAAAADRCDRSAAGRLVGAA
ncbi:MULTISPECIES: glycosyltransferase family 9 protein [unclassified Bradyrhizobium]